MLLNCYMSTKCLTEKQMKFSIFLTVCFEFCLRYWFVLEIYGTNVHFMPIIFYFVHFSQLSVYTIAKLISCIEVLLFDSFISIKCNIWFFIFNNIFLRHFAFTIIHDTQHITQSIASVYPAFNYLSTTHMIYVRLFVFFKRYVLRVTNTDRQWYLPIQIVKSIVFLFFFLIFCCQMYID